MYTSPLLNEPISEQRNADKTWVDNITIKHLWGQSGYYNQNKNKTKSYMLTWRK